MNTDSELLKRFAQTGESAPFKTIVERYLPMVYATACRQTNGDLALAKDVSQEVFASLARKAGKVAKLSGAGGWLHQASVFAAKNAMRSARRRRLREIAAQPSLMSEQEIRAEWATLKPVIDSVLAKVPEADREIVVLRFFRALDYAEIGRLTGKSADAARLQVNRALDRLRSHLERAGVESTEAAISLALEHRAEECAPPALSGEVLGGVLALAAAGKVGTVSSTAIKASWLGFLTTAVGAGLVVFLGHLAIAEWTEASMAAQVAGTAADNAAFRERELARLTRLLRAQAPDGGPIGPAPAAAADSSGAPSSPPTSPHVPRPLAPYAKEVAALASHPDIQKDFIAFFSGVSRIRVAELLRSNGISEQAIDRYIADENEPAGGMIDGVSIEGAERDSAAADRTSSVERQLPPGALQANARFYPVDEVIQGVAAQMALAGTALSREQGTQLAQAIAQATPATGATQISLASVDWQTVYEKSAGFLSSDQVQALKDESEISSAGFSVDSLKPGARGMYAGVLDQLQRLSP